MNMQADRDVRFGHALDQIQDENGVDVSLLESNLRLSVEERLVALEDFIRFADSVARADGQKKLER